MASLYFFRVMEVLRRKWKKYLMESSTDCFLNLHVLCVREKCVFMNECHLFLVNFGCGLGLVVSDFDISGSLSKISYFLASCVVLFRM